MPTTLGGAVQTVQTFASQSAAIDDPNFADSYRYQVIARAQDLLGFIDPVLSTTTFVVDRTTPTATILRPVHGNFISTTTLSFSSGSVNEPTGLGGIASGLSAVRVQIEDISDQATVAHAIPGGNLRFWNGTAWQAPSVSTTAVVYTSSWTLFNVPTDWVRGDASPNGRQYALRVIATDLAGNTGQFPNYQVAKATISFDGTPPTSSIVTPPGPDNADTVNLNTITGTAVDALVNASSSDVRAVYVSVQNDPA